MKILTTTLPLMGLLLTPTLAFAQTQPVPAVAPTTPAVTPAPAPVAAQPATPVAETAAPVVSAPAAETAPSVSAEASAPVEAPAPVAEPEVTEAAAAEPPPPPNQLSVGKKEGFFQPSALLQFWTVYTHQDQQKDTLGFKLRRAEIKIKGDIVPKTVSYQLMIDAAKATPKFKTVGVTNEDGDVVNAMQADGTDHSILQDFFITFTTDHADVSLGQFKIPLGLESLQSSSKLLFPERAEPGRMFGDKRDIGVRVDKKIGDYFYYQAGLFNGSGLNTAETDNDKAGALRLEVYPIKEVTVAAVGYSTIGARENSTKDRIEGDLRYEGNGLIAQAEYIRGWDGDGPTGAPTVTGHGVYAAAGYTIADTIQPILRVGMMDPNVDADAKGDMKTKFELGANYFIQAHEARLGLAAGFSQFEKPDVDGAEDVPMLIDVTFAAQVAF